MGGRRGRVERRQRVRVVRGGVVVRRSGGMAGVVWYGQEMGGGGNGGQGRDKCIGGGDGGGRRDCRSMTRGRGGGCGGVWLLLMRVWRVVMARALVVVVVVVVVVRERGSHGSRWRRHAGCGACNQGVHAVWGEMILKSFPGSSRWKRDEEGSRKCWERRGSE